MAELECWHVAFWTKNLRFGFRILFFTVLSEIKTRSEVFAHSHVVSIGFYGVPCLLRFRFWLATRLVSSVAFRPLPSRFSLSFLFPGGVGRGEGGGNVNVNADAACLLFAFAFLRGRGDAGGCVLTSTVLRLVIIAYVFLVIFNCFRGGGRRGAGGGGM